MGREKREGEEKNERGIQEERERERRGINKLDILG